MSVAQPHVPPPTAPEQREITIVSHSNLFYWWPVWFVGFILFLLSYFSGYRMATVPEGTKAVSQADVTIRNADGTKTLWEDRQALVLPEKHFLNPDNPREAPPDPARHMSRSKNYGVLFASVLLLVIVITNVPLRGMWSVMVIAMSIMVIIILWLAELWERIVLAWSLLDIRINAGGYLFISLVLFIIWLITFMLFDKQIYLTFTPGQLKVCTEIGGGEKVYDAVGMSLEKQRSDLFRHWILGLGSGDLVVKTAGAQAHHFDLPNVLFIGKKVQMIEDMLKKKAVVETR